jgi:CPA1 family monovalent cation:H+ antiporter
VAVTAVTERLRVPRRITTVLEGESLVNDASALVVYRFALAAAMGSLFSFWDACVQFPLVACGGVAIGLAMAWLLHQVHSRIEQPLIETAMTLLTPYAAYLFAEWFHTSGVLAVVTCGLVLSRHSPHLFSPQTRLTAVSFWNFLTFMLNGLVCILIGLQLPTILRELQGSLWRAVLEAGLLCVGLVVLRMVWVFPAAYLPHLIPSIHRREKVPPVQHVLLVGWIGMRGVVSLAAALALPEHLADGSALPARDRVLFLTFAVILVTLVGQSLTLAPIIAWLKIETPTEDRCEEAEARRRALTAAVAVLDTGEQSHVHNLLRSMYTHRLEHLADCRDEQPASMAENDLHRQTLLAQRKTLVQLRDKGQITDELLRKLERELDLEESRLPG